MIAFKTKITDASIVPDSPRHVACMANKFARGQGNLAHGKRTHIDISPPADVYAVRTNTLKGCQTDWFSIAGVLGVLVSGVRNCWLGTTSAATP